MDLTKKNKINVSVAVALVLMLWAAIFAATRTTPLKQKTITINNQKIIVEIADTADKRYAGLSGRENLCPDCGMLFKFTESQDVDFVMRDMKIPLDIIFINSSRVVKIAENLPPEGHDPKQLYSSAGPADQALEVNGGYAGRNGVKVGDIVSENN